MAAIWSASVPTTSCVHGCIIARVQESNRPNPGNSLGCPSSSSGACRKQFQTIPGLERSCNGVRLGQIGFESSGRILGTCWRRWPRRIRSVADRSGKRTVGSTGVGGGGQVSTTKEELGVMEGDVVEYPLASAGAYVGKEEINSNNGTQTGVGVIVDMFTDSDILLCHIEPLCQEDPGSKEWINDELQPGITVPIGQVRVLQAWYSQRMVPDRISNPHGEHAENLWILEQFGSPLD